MRNPFALLAMIIITTAAHAQGGPPMITDDPGTPGPGNWEINIAATAAHTGSSTEGERPLLDINYGVGSRIQLKYEVAWIAQHENDATRSGLGNSSLGIKWRFHDGAEGEWQVSAYPQIELRNPGSHSAERGFAERGTAVLLPFEFERAFDTFGVNFEMGREFRSQAGDAWLGGIVLGHDVSDSAEFMAELHGESSDSLHASTLAANFGARVTVNPLGTLLVSIGRELHNDFEGRPALFGYLGWQMTAQAR